MQSFFLERLAKDQPKKVNFGMKGGRDLYFGNSILSPIISKSSLIGSNASNQNCKLNEWFCLKLAGLLKLVNYAHEFVALIP